MTDDQKQGANQNPPIFAGKFFINSQLYFLNLISYFFLFACGVTVGIILSSQLRILTLDLHCTTSSISPNSTPPPPKPTSRVGLKEFLNPPGTRHDMNDEELLWRASLAPRIRNYPFNRVPKVAFLFLTKGPVLLAPLWEKFFKGNEGNYSIYIHSDPSFNESYSEGPIFSGRRIPSKKVEWGKPNMVEAERRLLANALLDISNQRFVLLSESCIPLFNFSTVYSYLINSKENFVESYILEDRVGNGRYSRKMSPQITLNQWRKGAQWFEMDRDLAIEVVSDQTYFPMFQKYCKGPCYSDEHYLPTFVTMKFPNRNANRTLTWVDWSKGGAHPNRFVRNEVTPEFLRELRNQTTCQYNGQTTNVCHLFARKFLTTALYRLLKFSPNVMHFNK